MAPNPRQRVLIQGAGGKLGTSTPEAAALLHSNTTRLRAAAQRDPNLVLAFQNPQDWYGLSNTAQIVPTRLPGWSQAQQDRNRLASSRLFADPTQAEAEYQRRQRVHEDRVVGGGQQAIPGKPGQVNRSFIANEIYNNIMKRYNSGQRNLVIDEIASDTDDEIAKALARLETEKRSDVLKGLSAYMVAGPTVRPENFDSSLLGVLRRNRIPIYGETYGGAAFDPKTGKRHKKYTPQAVAAQQAKEANTLRLMRKAGLAVQPMMSLAPQHVGQGPQAIQEARRRAWNLYRQTGQIPSVWHATSSRHPSPKGMGHAIQQWTTNMREDARRAAMRLAGSPDVAPEAAKAGARKPKLV